MFDVHTGKPIDEKSGAYARNLPGENVPQPSAPPMGVPMAAPVSSPFHQQQQQQQQQQLAAAPQGLAMDRWARQVQPQYPAAPAGCCSCSACAESKAVRAGYVVPRSRRVCGACNKVEEDYSAAVWPQPVSKRCMCSMCAQTQITLPPGVRVANSVCGCAGKASAGAFGRYWEQSAAAGQPAGPPPDAPYLLLSGCVACGELKVDPPVFQG